VPVAQIVVLAVVSLAWGPAATSLTARAEAEPAAEPDVTPSELVLVKSAVRRLHREAVILQSGDVSWAACSMAPRTPVVKGDFNGDGRSDYATLIRIGDVTPDGRWWLRYQGVDVWLVALFAEAAGTFSSLVVERYPETPLPTDVVIHLQRPGPVRSSIPGQRAKLKYPGVAVEFRERAGKVFYWSPTARSFRVIWTSD